MKILFLGFAVPDDVVDHYFHLDTLPAIQTHRFGWSVINSLKKIKGAEVFVASAVPVQNYPHCKKIIFLGGIFNTKDISGIYIKYINIILLKHITRLISCIIDVSIFAKKNRAKYVIVHGVHSPYLLYAVFLKNLGYKIIVIVSDPAGVVLNTDGFFSALLKRIDSAFIYWLTKKFHGHICLSKFLVEFSSTGDVIVFPGILSSEIISKIKDRVDINGQKFTIVYAGTLNKIYGINNLIDAIVAMNCSDIELLVYGRGDMEDYVEDASRNFRGIKYFGFLGTDELLNVYCRADLLINPRPINSMVAEMSFPSKLLEYAATGCPVLTTKIKSIPDEIGGCYYYIDDDSAEGIARAIDRVKAINSDVRRNFGLSAQSKVRKLFSEEAIGNVIGSYLGRV